jgi:SAM-dependent methyltransferase
MKKKYYSDHEGAYRTIKERGEFGWQAPTEEDFRKAMESDLITAIVKKHFPSTSGKKALDLGCGTGPTAQTLCGLGFETTGIDISPTAIELARKLNTSIHFEAADVLTFEGKFDFIYDSHCFHCIVLQDDRRAFLNRIKRNLLPDGVAFIDTMTWREGYVPDIKTLRFDENFILWHPTKDSSREGCELYGESWWCPQRRIYPADTIMQEIHAVGLKVIEKKIVLQKDNGPQMLQVLVSL